MSNTVLRVLLFAAYVGVLTSPGSAEENLAASLQSTLPKGWECLRGPNELDHPGTTFYIDKNGSRFELVDLGDKLSATDGDVSSAITGTSGTISAGILVKILGLGRILSLSGSNSYSSSIALFGRRESRTAENVARAAIRTIDPALIDENNTYFIIRDTQTAQKIRLTIDKAIAASFGGELPFKSLFTVSGAATSGTDTDKALRVRPISHAAQPVLRSRIMTEAA